LWPPNCAAGTGALALAGIALVALYTRPTARGRLSGRGSRHALGRVLAEHRGTLARAGSVSIALLFVRAGRQLLIPLWGAAIGFDAAQIGLVFSLSSGVDMCMFYPAGYLMDFRRRKWSVVPTLLLIGASLALLPLATSFVPYLAVALLSGLGNGLGTGIVMTLGADLSPPAQRGEFLGVWRLIGVAGALVMAVLVKETRPR